MDWQPIETAPGDGPYLVFGSLEEWTYAPYPPRQTGTSPARAYVSEHGASQNDDGAWRFSVDVVSIYMEPDWGTATHWMPLPRPPANNEKEHQGNS